MMGQKITEDKGLTVDYTGYESVSYAIIDTLATIKETEITGLKPLYNSVDLEAVDQLFEANTKDNLTVEQVIDGHTITIRGDGKLTISMEQESPMQSD